ncbi:glycosyl hydrolase 115 family protein [uncultured Bacteroides sp.]|uniref:glycosyl hydrolase 115 family protein n=1 Tax=uncultured Bacteroides sp. TaxID=162156 RepID=UPI002635931A|nr:glycosyl hydrolase 115 family protein [uncultured Bacteroides sp.]
MHKIASLLIFVLFVFTPLQTQSQNWISEQAEEGSFPFVTNHGDASLCYDSNEPPGVARAIGELQKDISRVTGRTLRTSIGDNLPHCPVIIGTVGYSKLIERLAQSGNLPLDTLRGKWESSLIAVVDNPLPDVRQALVIAGSDRRGTIFAIYELSRQLGVSPWHWWADAPVRHREEVYLPHSLYHFTDEPAIKYRGIFINDEFPCMTSWAREHFGGMNSQMYAHLYELLLRLKANCLWPAMWGSFKEYKPLIPILKDEAGLYEGNCFNEDDPLNPVTADDYGIVIGTSHHEPMQRSQQEWIRHKQHYGNAQWNYQTNRNALQRFFREGIDHCAGRENLITIGMRGDEDRPMEDAGSIEENFRLMKRIINDQRDIIRRATGRPAQETPQVWTLYSEVMDYYNQGLPVPDDVIVAFCDDNYGDIRRVPSLGNRRHPGGYGMYYHVSYYGGPRACKWLNTYQIEHLWEQLQLTYDYGVDRLWMLNVGSLKPHEYPIDFFMEMAWNPKRFHADNLHDYTQRFCASLFGEEHAGQAAILLETYSQYAARVTGELLDEHTYDLASNEYLQVRNEFLALEARALRLRDELPADAEDCYRQLILFPIQAMANLYDMYYGVAMNHKLAAEADLKANEWADHVELCFRRDSLLCSDYNHRMSHGKWNHMMDQVHIGYTEWHAPQHNICPKVHRVNTPKPQGGYTFHIRNGVAVIEAEHYYSAHTPEGTKWTIIPRYGRTLSGIALTPYTSPVQGAGLSYRIKATCPADSVEVRLILKSTMPFLGNGGHRVKVGFQGASAREININGLLTWDNKYTMMYPTGAARIIELHVRLPLPAKETSWTLKFEPLDPGVVLHKVVVNNGGYRESFLKMTESEYER